ncbi:hypothetical protein K0M31_017011 [Melipona bicolor]|uniref:Uncharacterized protein n=1 Tax=Melipona bicolor TaxID=60889 RepID=A0AA40KE70_9HYME|nr:hypothetical protein K0M31_017011 [Melipona bicolor]
MPRKERSQRYLSKHRQPETLGAAYSCQTVGRQSSGGIVRHKSPLNDKRKGDKKAGVGHALEGKGGTGRLIRWQEGLAYEREQTYLNDA